MPGDDQEVTDRPKVMGVTVGEFFATTAKAREESQENAAVWFVTDERVYAPVGATISDDGDLCIHMLHVADMDPGDSRAN
jgi:hypothetical protein